MKRRTWVLAVALILALLPVGVQASTWSSNQVGSTETVDQALGDLDNDGDIDIVSVSTDSVIVWENNGTPFSNTWSSNVAGTVLYGMASLQEVRLGDLDNDGDLDIVAVAQTDETTLDYELLVWQNDGSPFTGTWTENKAAVSTYWLYSVEVGDLDSDGDLDIVTGGHYGLTYEIAVWENDGTPFSGTWTSNGAGTTNPESISSLAVGDLDNDGDLDIVSADESDSIDVWQNDGTPFSGTWASNSAGSSTASVNALALGDLDHDGDLDIVSGSSSGEDYEVIVWQNDSTPFSGTWAPNNAGASAATVFAVALGDLDDDGDLDIVSGSHTFEDYEVIAWRNDGTPFSGLWTQSDVGACTAAVESVALGDLDDDGDLDIVSGDGGGIFAWQNPLAKRKLSFLRPGHQVSTSTTDVNAIAVGDLDNDGDLDIVSGESVSMVAGNNEVVAWQNDGTPFDGDWPGMGAGNTLVGVYAVALGDLDNDGDLDIASAVGSNVIVWENDGTPFVGGTWSYNNAGSSTDYVYSLALGDLDDDGDLDIVSGSGSGEDYELIAWQNDGTPFTDAWTTNDAGASTDDVRTVALGDLDNDGDLDIVSGSDSGEDYEVIAWGNDGTPFSGTWAQNDVGTTGASVYAVALGDMANDGYPEILSASTAGADYELVAWRGDDTPLSGPWAQYDVGASTTVVWSVALGDLNDDGDLDVVSGCGSVEDYEAIAWQPYGTPFWGLGGWNQHDVGASGADMLAVAVGDLDNDGDLDIIAGNSDVATSEIVIWENEERMIYLPLVLR